MLFYSASITPRVDYIVNFIGKEIFGQPFSLETNKEVFMQAHGPKINYSPERYSKEEFWLQPQNLLFENNMVSQRISCFESGSYKAFFKTAGDFPFDIFAASFYLLSRYEEYLPHNKDSYGRYAHQNSLAFRENFLHLPLVNTWLRDFKKALQTRFLLPLFPDPTAVGSTFFPTYDIDEAFSYKHKPLWKNAAGFIKSIFKGEWRSIAERIKVISGKQQDPYDAYQWMDQLHQRYNLKPYYFFILADKTGRYDKNINPGKEAMRNLVKHHYYRYPLGIHPSWQSGDRSPLIKKEIQNLEQVTGGKIISSRQHYIRFTLPETYRYLSDAGIEFDFSMGYGSINGFRASVASPFYWYDLQKETTTKLLLYPFCYMDANSFFEQKNTAQEAYLEMKKFYEIVQQSGGTMISIWHNNFLGTAEPYAGWREAYEKFIAEISA